MHKKTILGSFAALAGILLLVVAAATGVAAVDPGPITMVDAHVQEQAGNLEASISWLSSQQEPARLYFEHRQSGTNTWQTTSSVTVDDNSVNSVDVSGLTAGTEYEFRAVLETADGHTYRSKIKTFTTEGTPPDDGGGISGVLEPLRRIYEKISTLPQEIAQAAIDAIHGVFKAAAQALVDLLTVVMTAHPQVYPNQEVGDIHRTVYTASLLLSGASIVFIGIAHMLGFINAYQTSIRVALGRLIAALALGAVAPQLVQLGVDLSHALTVAFKPTDPSLLGTALLSGHLLVVAFLDAFILLGVLVVFILRDVYFMFFAAAAPLIFLLGALPHFRRFAQSLIGVFLAFMLIGPLDMIAFRLTLAMLNMNSLSGLPEWLLAFGGIVALLGIPYIVLSSGMSMVGLMFGLAAGAKTRVRKRNTDQQNVSGQERVNSHQRGSAQASGRYDPEVILDDR